DRRRELVAGDLGVLAVLQEGIATRWRGHAGRVSAEPLDRRRRVGRGRRQGANVLFEDDRRRRRAYPGPIDNGSYRRRFGVGLTHAAERGHEPDERCHFGSRHSQLENASWIFVIPCLLLRRVGPAVGSARWTRGGGAQATVAVEPSNTRRTVVRRRPRAGRHTGTAGEACLTPWSRPARAL